jgi:ferredoxin
LPVRLCILVTARNEAVARQFQLNVISDQVEFIPADPALIEQRDHLLANLAERQQRTRERVLSSLSEHLPADVDEIVTMFDVCGSCQACMEVCPICSVDFPRRGADGKYLYQDLARWLISCAGCGMCEQACPHHLPLSAIFGRIREQLAETTHYRPGHRLEEPLPLQSADLMGRSDASS